MNELDLSSSPHLVLGGVFGGGVGGSCFLTCRSVTSTWSCCQPLPSLSSAEFGGVLGGSTNFCRSCAGRITGLFQQTTTNQQEEIFP